MSEVTSPVSTPAGEPEGRSPKRLRIDIDYEHTPLSSFADEGVTDIDGKVDEDGDEEEERSEREESQDRTSHASYQDEDAQRRTLQDSPTTEVGARAETASPKRRRRKLRYRPTMILRGHKKGVTCVKFSPDGKWIASCCGSICLGVALDRLTVPAADATIKIWDSATGKHVQTLEGHLAGISTIAWGPDSKMLASGSDDKSIRLWHVPTV